MIKKKSRNIARKKDSCGFAKKLTARPKDPGYVSIKVKNMHMPRLSMMKTDTHW